MVGEVVAIRRCLAAGIAIVSVHQLLHRHRIRVTAIIEEPPEGELKEGMLRVPAVANTSQPAAAIASTPTARPSPAIVGVVITAVAARVGVAQPVRVHRVKVGGVRRVANGWLVGRPRLAQVGAEVDGAEERVAFDLVGTEARLLVPAQAQDEV